MPTCRVPSDLVFMQVPSTATAQDRPAGGGVMESAIRRHPRRADAAANQKRGRCNSSTPRPNLLNHNGLTQQRNPLRDNMIHNRTILRRNAIRGSIEPCSRRSEAVFLEPLAALGQVSARYIHQDSEGFFLFSSDLAGNFTDQSRFRRNLSGHGGRVAVDACRPRQTHPRRPRQTSAVYLVARQRNSRPGNHLNHVVLQHFS